MQVQPSPGQQQPLQTTSYHGHPPQAPVSHPPPHHHIYNNGGASTYAPQSASEPASDMQQYQQQYQTAYGTPPQHQQQQQPGAPRGYQTQSQLPPLQMGAVGMGAMSHMSAPGGMPPGHYLPTLQQPGQQLPSSAAAVQRPVKLQHEGSDDKYEYKLIVEQQPQRARMCGFGDKDRRPITPPPCIRLVILDRVTRKEVDFGEVDSMFFVLQVDLWDESATREVNIVRASSSSPAVSISTATTTSFPPTPDRHYSTDLGRSLMYATGPDGQPYAGYAYQNMGGATPYGGAMQYPGYGYGMNPYAPQAPPSAGGSGNNNIFTRNLIGSLTVNASRLNDPSGKPGYWFVLQDLSVRTEGHFRLKMNFIDVGAQSGSGLNRGRAPVLAWIFSDVFQVYSAKKFPGVIESTPLSKCFAGQGIKIPIRKDNAKNDGGSPED